eukprot:COSAG02_NODE_4735_length_5038_cov_116.051427_7_plen_76_part_00
MTSTHGPGHVRNPMRTSLYRGEPLPYGLAIGDLQKLFLVLGRSGSACSALCVCCLGLMSAIGSADWPNFSLTNLR